MHTCGWAPHPLCVTSCQCQHSLQTEGPILKPNKEPFHTYMLPCVNTFHTVKSWLLLLPLFCFTAVFMSFPFSASEVWTPAGLLWQTCGLITSMTGQLKGAQYLLDTQSVVGARSAVEFAMASLSDQYRGGPLSSNVRGGLSYLSLILYQTTEVQPCPRLVSYQLCYWQIGFMD